MTHAGYLAAGYSVTFGAIAAYAAWVGLRRRVAMKALEAAAPPAREN